MRWAEEVETVLEDISMAPGGRLSLVYGDILRVTSTVNYRGPAASIQLVAQVGDLLPVIGFFLEAYTVISFAPSAAWSLYTMTVDFPVTRDFPTGLYDLRLLLLTKPSLSTPVVEDVIEILGAPEFSDFRITDYSKVV